ncbi:hypothetical protein [Pseudomarimonas arenosa]|uniref:DUF983 domain-containing protein n=1 Tax=Pseudomarimonas arenosa TaxID=2774145 RepID=A0AAW3ZJ08_9GAMM|nr:hypothetical protein [Pseudomarimonas arenosa]MBD8524301.1 hypothetical protein [Pseudomarimonas arenosa]
MKLEQTQVRVPRWQRHWWQGEDNLEYRCPACGEFHRLNISLTGWVLYVALLAALSAAWMAQVNRMGILGAGLVTAALLYRHAVALRPASAREARP